MKSKFFFSLVIVFAFFLGGQANAQNITIGGESFPTKMKISDKIVYFNGGGVRNKYFIALYVSSLYVPKRTTNAKEIINQNTESAVRIKVTSKLVTRERFIESVREGFGTSTEGKATQKEIDDFMKLFSGEFHNGDDIILIYKPNKGIVVYMNGKNLGLAEGGIEFKKALWGIWLGDKPVNKKLKDEMLGKV